VNVALAKEESRYILLLHGYLMREVCIMADLERQVRGWWARLVAWLRSGQRADSGHKAKAMLEDIRGSEARRKAEAALKDLREGEAGRKAREAVRELREGEAGRKAREAVRDLRDSDAARKAKAALRDLRDGAGRSGR
jgi:hypothetical protein